MPPPTQADLDALQARLDREHSRRCALETFFARLSLQVGPDLIDRAWAEMELRHGRQAKPESGAATEGGAA